MALAALVIGTRYAQAAVVVEEQAPALAARRGGLLAAALPEPQGEPSDNAPASCPYHFTSDMPAATFCVYRGGAFTSDGQLCAADAVVIWSSTERPSGLSREVYLAFVANPELVLRAIVDSRQDDRAEMVGYVLGTNEAPQPLAGRLTLHTMHPGSADVLSIDLHEPRLVHAGGCAFASYSGTFLGMIRPPSATTSVDPVIIPQ